MGFLKKITRAVTAPVIKPVQSLTTSVVEKTGVQDVVKKSVGIDINNMVNVVADAQQLKGSTGSTAFKNAAFDAAKIGIAASTGGAGSGALLTYGQGAGAVLLASKIQNKGGVTLGDIGSVAGFDPTLSTGFGDVDLSNTGIIRPRNQTPAQSNGGAYLSDYIGEGAATVVNSNKYLIIGVSVLALIAGFILVRKIK